MEHPDQIRHPEKNSLPDTDTEWSIWIRPDKTLRQNNQTQKHRQIHKYRQDTQIHKHKYRQSPHQTEKTPRAIRPVRGNYWLLLKVIGGNRSMSILSQIVYDPLSALDFEKPISQLPQILHSHCFKHRWRISKMYLKTFP